MGYVKVFSHTKKSHLIDDVTLNYIKYYYFLLAL